MRRDLGRPGPAREALQRRDCRLQEARTAHQQLGSKLAEFKSDALDEERSSRRWRSEVRRIFTGTEEVVLGTGALFKDFCVITSGLNRKSVS